MSDVEELRARLTAPSATARAEALSHIAKMPATQLVECGAAIAPLLLDSDELVRSRASELLVQIGLITPAIAEAMVLSVRRTSFQRTARISPGIVPPQVGLQEKIAAALLKTFAESNTENKPHVVAAMMQLAPDSLAIREPVSACLWAAEPNTFGRPSRELSAVARSLQEWALPEIEERMKEPQLRLNAVYHLGSLLDGHPDTCLRLLGELLERTDERCADSAASMLLRNDKLRVPDAFAAPLLRLVRQSGTRGNAIKLLMRMRPRPRTFALELKAAIREEAVHAAATTDSHHNQRTTDLTEALAALAELGEDGTDLVPVIVAWFEHVGHYEPVRDEWVHWEGMGRAVSGAAALAPESSKLREAIAGVVKAVERYIDVKEHDVSNFQRNARAALTKLGIPLPLGPKRKAPALTIPKVSRPRGTTTLDFSDTPVEDLRARAVAAAAAFQLAPSATPQQRAKAVDIQLRRSRRLGEQIAPELFHGLIAIFGFALSDATGFNWKRWHQKKASGLCLTNDDQSVIVLVESLVAKNARARESDLLLTFNLLAAGRLPPREGDQPVFIGG